MKFGWPRVERDAARVAELRSDASAADESGSLQNGSIGRAQHPANLALLTLGASETALTFLVDLVPLADRRCERSAEVTGTTTLIEKPMPALAGCAICNLPSYGVILNTAPRPLVPPEKVVP